MADTSTSTQTSWIQPQWNSYLSGLSGLLGKQQDGSFAPLPTYGGPTVAPYTQAQSTALDMGLQAATNGSPALNAANGAIVNQANGVMNPYAGQANPYMGSDPYTQQVISGLNKNMADAYARGTAAQTDAAMARQGAFGGSGYNELTAANNQQFANAVGNADAQLLNQNYYNNANLAQQQIQNQIGAFDNSQNRSLQAAGLGLGSAGVDWNAINNLNNLGNQQQGYQQNILGGMQNQFGQQVQSNFAPYSIYGNALSQAQGGQTTTTNSVPDYNRLMQYLGGGLALYGVLNGG